MYISRMITKSMQLNSKVRLVVFDPDSGVVQKLRRQLSLRIPKFQQERVIRVSGDCAETLPDFLSGKLREASKKEQKAATLKACAKRPIASSADKDPNNGIE